MPAIQTCCKLISVYAPPADKVAIGIMDSGVSRSYLVTEEFPWLEVPQGEIAIQAQVTNEPTVCQVKIDTKTISGDHAIINVTLTACNKEKLLRPNTFQLRVTTERRVIPSSRKTTDLG